MKRSDMLMKLQSFFEYDILECAHDAAISATRVLDIIEEAGMLPPVQNPSLVEDTYNGGEKHGPALRVWDKE